MSRLRAIFSLDEWMWNVFCMLKHQVKVKVPCCNVLKIQIANSKTADELS